MESVSYTAYMLQEETPVDQTPASDPNSGVIDSLRKVSEDIKYNLNEHKKIRHLNFYTIHIDYGTSLNPVSYR